MRARTNCASQEAPQIANPPESGMLFNSYLFIFVFLPATLIGYFCLRRFAPRTSTGFLAAASLFFYGWWDPAHLLLISLSIAFNYPIGFADPPLERRPPRPSVFPWQTRH